MPSKGSKHVGRIDMNNLLMWMMSIAFTFPFVCLVILLVILQMLVKNKKKSILLTIDLSTIFFIISVHFHLVTIFEQSFLLYMIIGLLCLLLINYYVDLKKAKKFSIKNVFKKVWRLSFLIFFLSYLSLVVYGSVSSMITYAFL
ncbi:DUF3397 domain-containing protein [Metabacillus sediminilitoris]|uniref:DUF3397 domain-containing protein n=2 Tax=Metabacillus sediminilitoris TaxID=2567941 RepID=A0A4S4C5L5_9BACI|nr:DUF3397 family protein [Metabacillus sediminilitoris]THF83106.1 DUF3397 domain-containing protein [Metabacillus sediminilitoris]